MGEEKGAERLRFVSRDGEGDRKEREGGSYKQGLEEREEDGEVLEKEVKEGGEG